MFNSAKDRPNGGGSGSGSGDGGGPSQKNDRAAAHDKKSERVSRFRFRNAQKYSHKSNSRSSQAAPRLVGAGLCLCFRPSPTLDSPGESQISDPNSSEYNFELLKGLIESNDFYSRECNTHLDDYNS